MPEAPSTTTSSRNLILIMTTVVLFFLIGTGISQYHLATIESHVRDSIGNALPSANRLSEARAHLYTLINAAIDLSEDSPFSKEEIRRQIVASEHELRSAYAAYLTLPQFPEEQPMAIDIERQIEVFSAALKVYLEHKDFKTTRAIRAQGSLLDEKLRRVIEFELTHGERLSLNIAKLRFESLALSILLDALCVALAVAAALLAIRFKNKSFELLEERASELENFAFRVAHDLKNPLGVIKMSSDLVHSDTLDEGTRKFMEKISDTSKNMATMIDGLLDFARSAARPEPGARANVSGVLNSILMWAKPEAEKAGIQLRVVPFVRETVASCSEVFLNSIISNLVRNALRYVRDGASLPHSVAIKITEVGSFVRIEIADNGPGVAKDKLEAIFEPYFRVSTKYQGIGLGLATVKRFVESYGGKLGLNSEPGMGCRFWVELPRA